MQKPSKILENHPRKASFFFGTSGQGSRGFRLRRETALARRAPGTAGPRSAGEWEWDDNVNVNGFISMGSFPHSAPVSHRMVPNISKSFQIYNYIYIVLHSFIYNMNPYICHGFLWVLNIKRGKGI